MIRYKTTQAIVAGFFDSFACTSPQMVRHQSANASSTFAVNNWDQNNLMCPETLDHLALSKGYCVFQDCSAASHTDTTKHRWPPKILFETINLTTSPLLVSCHRLQQADISFPASCTISDFHRCTHQTFGSSQVWKLDGLLDCLEQLLGSRLGMQQSHAQRNLWHVRKCQSSSAGTSSYKLLS